MNKSLLVLRYEIQTTLARRSFIVAAFVLPLVLVIAVVVLTALRGGPAPTTSALASGTPARPLKVEGYVDHSGLIRIIPEDIAGKLIAYLDEARVSQALQAGEIAAYYVVPADYLQSGDLLYVNPDLRLFESEGQSWVMRWTLQVNLVNGDVQLARHLQDPMNVQVTALAPAQEREPGFGSQMWWIPYCAAMILYMGILLEAGLLRSSVGGERKNRLLEILMTSVQPQQLLAGKIAGLGILGLLQTAVWAGAGYASLRLSGQAFSWPASVTPPVSIVAWVLVFFVLGYAVYASLLAGLGALTGPNTPGSSAADIWVVWPLVVPMMLQVIFVLQPHGAASTALSLFPLTAPVAMIMRLAVGGVPWWHPFLASGLMLATAVLVVRAVGRMFRAQTLLSGQAFKVSGYVAALLGRP